MDLSLTKTRESAFQVKLILLLFILSFIVNFFLMQDVPFYMYGNDVFAHSWEAKSTSWVHLFSGLFTERISTNTNDPENFYMSIGQRSTTFIIVKGFFIFDGMRSPQLRALFSVIIFSLNTILIFLILNNLHVSKLISFLGALIYATSVPTYSIISHIIDASLYYHFFTLLCFYLFLTRYLKQEKTNPIIISIIIFVLAVLAIKSKQIAIIIPLVLFIYCVFVKQNINGVMKRRIPLFSILLLYYLPNFFTSNVHRSFLDLLLNLRTYYFYNPWTRIGEGELIPAIFSPIESYNVAAGSLMGIYKFLFGWVFIILFLFFLISIYQIYRKENKIEHRDCLSFILLWHFLEVVVMINYISPSLYEAIRYIGIATPSFIVFTFYSMQHGLNFILTKEHTKKFKKAIYLVFVISIILAIGSNFYVSTIQIRGGLLSRHTLIHDSIFVVYKDYFKQEKIDDTIFFKVFDEFDYPESRDKERKLGSLFYTELIGGFGIDYSENNLDDIKQKIEDNGFVYIATFKPEIPFANKTLLKILSPCPPESSVYCKLKNKVKNQDRFFYVYKVNLIGD